MDETTLRQLLRDVVEGEPGPSPDMPRFVLRRGRRRLAMTGVIGVLAATALAVGAVTGVRALQGAPQPQPANRTPQPAPIGTLPGTIAFSANGPDGRQVYVVGPDGTITQITHGPARNELGGWSPDGFGLFVLRGSGNVLDRDLLLVSPDGSSETRLTAYPPGWDGGGWSPDGTKIAFHTGNGIDVMNADGSGVRQLAADPTPPFAESFSWSPDSSRIAVTRNGADAGIYVMNPDGTGMTRLSGSGPTSGQYWEVAWSPDGSRIAFVMVVHWEGGGTLRMFVMNANGTGARQLTPPIQRGSGDECAPKWSPDGSMIAFTECSRLGSHIYLASADGSGVRELVPGAMTLTAFMNWSPDGSKIAFMSFTTKDSVPDTEFIDIVNADGSGLTRVTEDVGGTPLWQPTP